MKQLRFYEIKIIINNFPVENSFKSTLKTNYKIAFTEKYK